MNWSSTRKSPAQMLFGRNIRNKFYCISRWKPDEEMGGEENKEAEASTKYLIYRKSTGLGISG